MEAVCYLCGKPARYTCDAPGCGRPMCEEHSTLALFPDITSAGAEDIVDRADAAQDHAHLCADHAAAARP